jgi:hypothetical protein
VQSVAAASARIQAIVEAAEKAAAGIIDDAEAQARAYVEESRLRADRVADQRAREMALLSDTLVERAEAIKGRSDELLQVLEEARRQAEAGSRPTPMTDAGPGAEAAPGPAPGAPFAVQAAPAAGAEQPPAEAPVHHLKPVEEAAPVTDAGPPLSAPADGARLLATQMAVAGSSRAEIENRLRGEFGISDSGPMLDAILGREG